MTSVKQQKHECVTVIPFSIVAKEIGKDMLRYLINRGIVKRVIRGTPSSMAYLQFDSLPRKLFRADSYSRLQSSLQFLHVTGSSQR